MGRLRNTPTLKLKSRDFNSRTGAAYLHHRRAPQPMKWPLSELPPRRSEERFLGLGSPINELGGARRAHLYVSKLRLKGRCSL